MTPVLSWYSSYHSCRFFLFFFISSSSSVSSLNVVFWGFTIDSLLLFYIVFLGSKTHACSRLAKSILFFTLFQWILHPPGPPRPEARVLSPEKRLEDFLATMHFCLYCWKFLVLCFILTKELYLFYCLRPFILLYCFKNTWSRTFIFPCSIFSPMEEPVFHSRCVVAMWSFSLSFGKFIISTHWWVSNFNYLYTTEIFEMGELPSVGWVGYVGRLFHQEGRDLRPYTDFNTLFLAHISLLLSHERGEE